MNAESSDLQLEYSSTGLPGTSALPRMVQESVSADQQHNPNISHLAAPRPLVDPHRRCVTPPRPEFDESAYFSNSQQWKNLIAPSTFLFPGYSFVGKQYWPHNKSRKRKQTLRGLARSQQQQQQSRSYTNDADNVTRHRLQSFIRDINPDLRQLLSLPNYNRQPELEVEADSDIEAEMGLSSSTPLERQHTPGQRIDYAGMAHEELLENIRRLREVTEQTAQQIQRIHDSLPSTSRGCPHQKQEWEVRVHLETVDWAAGHVEGIMETNNYQSSRGGAFASPHFKVHTVLHGDIVDGVNHSLFRPIDPWWMPSQKAIRRRNDQDCLVCLPPFAGMEAAAIKETSYNTSDWLIMRWKEVEFLQPTPNTVRDTLSITGCYWLALSRRTGELTGVYVDEPDKPVQRIELNVDKSPWSAAPWSGDFGLV